MTSIRNNEDRYLDAARECILATGWKRTTLTDVARRAGVSRMTIYRTWPDMETLLADLMTREWGGVVTEVASAGEGGPLERLSQGVARTVSALRSNDLFRKIVEVDPELLLPYLLQRRGRSQDNILALTADLIAAGQADGSVRAGDPTLLARSMLLAAHGFTLSAETMAETTAETTAESTAESGRTVEAFDEELRLMLERYLAP